MKIEKREEILKEVIDEIDSALKDNRGLVFHQRRLAFLLSLGALNILELYLHNLNVIKEGVKLNHLWFKRKRQTINEYLQNQIISPISSIKDMEKIIDLIIQIEEKRDDLAYGAKANEEVIQQKINLFFKLWEFIK